MKHFSHIILPLIFAISLFSFQSTHSQMGEGVYFLASDGQKQELKVKGNYLTWSVYGTAPAKFIKTVGGFYRVEDGKLLVDLEFNSNFESDGKKELSYPLDVSNNSVTIKAKDELVFSRAETEKQELDGMWLFATRGPDTGQERRGDENPRKTLKFLIDGRFQWIAYNTETFKFHGTGGGFFTSTDGVYTENIEFFSRDDSRVGATLAFDYEVKGNDWHHTGKNSKGEPMYEIWSKR